MVEQKKAVRKNNWKKIFALISVLVAIICLTLMFSCGSVFCNGKIYQFGSVFSCMFVFGIITLILLFLGLLLIELSNK